MCQKQTPESEAYPGKEKSYLRTTCFTAFRQPAATTIAIDWTDKDDYRLSLFHSKILYLCFIITYNRELRALLSEVR